ncbi:MAG: GatB/YqeY domain-containing protein [Candidatus Omnitrophota bacterium]
MLEKDISLSLQQALKAGEKIKISTLRLLVNDIKNRKIAERTAELEDPAVIGIIHKMVKQRRESIEQFKQGGRDDLVEIEENELAVLESYLPEQISEGELEGIVAEVISQTGATSMKEMGKVMKEVMNKVQGQADGVVVSNMVKKKLSQNR